MLGWTAQISGINIRFQCGAVNEAALDVASHALTPRPAPKVHVHTHNLRCPVLSSFQKMSLLFHLALPKFANIHKPGTQQITWIQHQLSVSKEIAWYSRLSNNQSKGRQKQTCCNMLRCDMLWHVVTIVQE